MTTKQLEDEIRKLKSDLAISKLRHEETIVRMRIYREALEDIVRHTVSVEAGRIATKALINGQETYSMSAFDS